MVLLESVTCIAYGLQYQLEFSDNDKNQMKYAKLTWL